MVQRGVKELRLLDRTAEMTSPRLNRATRTAIDMPFPTCGVAEVLAGANYIPASYATALMRNPRLHNTHRNAMQLMHSLGL